jgi:hypothetical protein
MNCIWKMFSFCNNLSVNNKIITVKSRRQRYLDVAFINNSREAVSLRFKVLVNSMLIIEDPTVNVECRTALKWLFFDFNLCWSTICWIVSQLHLHPYQFLLKANIHTQTDTWCHKTPLKCQKWYRKVFRLIIWVSDTESDQYCIVLQ